MSAVPKQVREPAQRRYEWLQHELEKAKQVRQYAKEALADAEANVERIEADLQVLGDWLRNNP